MIHNLLQIVLEKRNTKTKIFPLLKFFFHRRKFVFNINIIQNDFDLLIPQLLILLILLQCGAISWYYNESSIKYILSAFHIQNRIFLQANKNSFKYSVYVHRMDGMKLNVLNKMQQCRYPFFQHTFYEYCHDLIFMYVNTLCGFYE